MFNRIIYNQEELFVFPISGEQSPGSTFYLPQAKVLRKIERIQSVNYSLEQKRADVSTFGQKANVFKGIISSPQGVLNFSYIPDGITNENRLGFNISYQNKYFNGNIFSGICTNNQYINKRDFYLVVNNNSEDVDSRSTISPSFIFPNSENDVIHPRAKDFQVIHFQDCYLNQYAFDLRLNQLPKIEQNYIFNNIIFYSSGSGLNYTTLDIVSGFNNKTDAMIIFPKDIDTNSQMISGQNILTPNNLSIDIITNNNNTIKFYEETIQSFNFNVNFNRKTVRSINYRFPIIEKINFPVNGEISISLLVNNVLSGSFFETLNKDQDYNIALTFDSNPLKRNVDITKYIFSGCKFNGISYNSAIGDNKSADLNFIFDIDPDFNTRGLFVSGNVLKYQGFPL